jgi:hypothetical protein
MRQAFLTRIILAMIFLSVFPQAFSQEQGVASDKVITIKSYPPGALVSFEGEYQFAGRTPFVLPYPVVGRYHIKAYKIGYETFDAKMQLLNKLGDIMTFRLQPKTPFKAFYRSLVVPGWGQFYSERGLIGSVFLGAAAGALFYLAKNEEKYQDAVIDYEQASARLDGSGASVDDQQEIMKELQSFEKTLQEDMNRRDTSLYIAGGIWLLNILDSVLFFPNHAKDVQIFNLNTFISSGGQDIRLSMTYPLR